MSNHKQIVEKYQNQIASIVGDFDIQIKEFEVSFSDKFEAGTYTVKLKESGDEIATFSLVPMINCCGIIVSTKAGVHANYRNKGLGTILNSLRIDIARELGYGILLCTDVMTNEPQQKILKSNGWKAICDFINPRTKNRVGIHIINL